MFVALQLTVVVPSGNVDPDAGLQTTGAFSSAVATYVTTAPAALVASAMMFAGRCRVGAVVSWTVTVKLPLWWFACASVVEQFTVVVPMAKVEPEVGAQVTASVPSTMSVAVAV